MYTTRAAQSEPIYRAAAAALRPLRPHTPDRIARDGQPVHGKAGWHVHPDRTGLYAYVACKGVTDPVRLTIQHTAYAAALIAAGFTVAERLGSRALIVSTGAPLPAATTKEAAA